MHTGARDNRLYRSTIQQNRQSLPTGMDGYWRGHIDHNRELDIDSRYDDNARLHNQLLYKLLHKYTHNEHRNDVQPGLHQLYSVTMVHNQLHLHRDPERALHNDDVYFYNNIY